MGCGEAVAVAPAVESLCEQLTTYKVVMEPTYVTETRAVSGTETRTETHQRTKKVYTSVPVTVTRYDSVAEDVVEEYTVSVPVCVMKEVQVQVCKMVPRLVEEVIDPCAAGASSSGSNVAPMTGSGCGSAAGCGAVSDGGCGGCGAAATPVSTGCGCN